MSERPSAAKQSFASARRVCAVLTCFNRRDKTAASLRALESTVQADSISQMVELRAVLVDDGSSDGTADAVTAEFPWVRIVGPRTGEGPLFWCRGMHRAIDEAMSERHELYLWLNDDTMLQPDALERLIACHDELRHKMGAAVIVVGSTVDHRTGRVTYGGSSRRSVLRAVRFERVMPSSSPQRCDTMNGNVVLMADDVLRRVGNLEPVYEHAMGDIDYALRAGKAGITAWVAPGIYGTCSNNPAVGTFNDASLPLARRWQLMMSRKGLPWRSWLLFTRRHAGWLWPLHFVWPYFSLLIPRRRRVPLNTADESTTSP